MIANKSNAKLSVIKFVILSTFLLIISLFGIDNKAITAHAHSGNTDSNGGHYEHSQACRKANYNTNHIGCSYHYHSSNVDMDSILKSIPKYEFEKKSDEEMREYFKLEIEKIKIENYDIMNSKSSKSFSNSSDSTDNCWVLILIIMTGLTIIGYKICEKRKHYK